MSEPLVDQSLNLIRSAARIVGKKPLATRAGISDAILRFVYEQDYSPTARTLRKLELAAMQVLAEQSAQSDCPTSPSHEVAA